MVKKKSIYRRMAEKVLGEKVAEKKHAALYRGEPVDLAVNGKPAQVGWGELLRRDLKPYQPGEKTGRRWSHVWTTYAPLWHVELRDPHGWRRKPTHKDFLWMALALLSIDHPLLIPGVAHDRCISIWSRKGVTEEGGAEGWIGEGEE